MRSRPRARTEGVVAEWVGDELVVFDRHNQTAHCLSASAASVRERCDGRLLIIEIAQQLKLEPDVVQQAVDELQRCGLLDSRADDAYSRREATVRLAKVGGAALLIYSAAVGPAMAAVSCLANNSPEPTCTAASGQKKSDARCCSGTCYNAAGTKTCAAAVCVVIDGLCVPGLNQCCAGPNHCSGGLPSVCVA